MSCMLVISHRNFHRQVYRPILLNFEYPMHQLSNAPINVLPHPPTCGQTLGIGGDLPTCEDIASPLGQITRVKLHLIPVLLYMGICRDLLHSSYSHDNQVGLAGEIPGCIFVNHYLTPVLCPYGDRWGYTSIDALIMTLSAGSKV